MSETTAAGPLRPRKAAADPFGQLGRRLGGGTLDWIMVLSLLGYPLVALVGIYFGSVNRDLSVAFRVVVICLAIFGANCVVAARLRFRANLLLVIFLLFYGTRLTYDAPFLRTGADNLKFFIATLVIPLIPVFALASLWDDRTSARLTTWFGALTSAGLMLAPILAPSRFRVLTITTGRFSYDVIDPITIGNVGAVTVLAAVAALSHLRRPTLSIIIALVAGTICLLMPLSRGPVLAFLGTISIYLLLRRHWGWLSLVVISLVLVLLIDDTILTRYRLVSLGREASAQQRVQVMNYALSEIADHPLLGLATFEPRTGNYPHNVFVDAALSLGLVGAVFALFLLGKSLWRAISLLSRGMYFLPMLVAYWIFEAQVSGAIWTSPGLWLSIGVVLSLSPRVLSLKSTEDLQAFAHAQRSP